MIRTLPALLATALFAVAASAQTQIVHSAFDTPTYEVGRSMGGPGLWLAIKTQAPTTMVAALETSRAPVLFSHSSARRARSSAAGTPAKIASRFSDDSGSLTPPGTHHAGWMRFPPSRSMMSCPNFRNITPSVANSGCFLINPNTFRSRGSASMPSIKSGLER